MNYSLEFDHQWRSGQFGTRFRELLGRVANTHAMKKGGRSADFIISNLLAVYWTLSLESYVFVLY